MKRSLIAAIAIGISAFTLACAQSGEETPSDEAAYGASAVFAGGCFWCMESDFEKLDGVGDVVSGYAGGVLQKPTYEKHDGHLEVVRVPYDPAIISYRELVDYFFRHIDPLDDGGQFCDRGHSYTSAVFYSTADEFAAANAGKDAAAATLNEKIVTPVIELDQFWIAEGYHQDYYKKNPIRYKFYRTSCGRDHRVKKVWGAH